MVWLCCCSARQNILGQQLLEESTCYKNVRFAVYIIMTAAITLFALAACFLLSMGAMALTNKVINIIEYESPIAAFIVRGLLCTASIAVLIRLCKK